MRAWGSHRRWAQLGGPHCVLIVTVRGDTIGGRISRIGLRLRIRSPLSGNTVHVICGIVTGTNASCDNRHLELPTRSGTIIPVDTTVALHKSQGAAPRVADAIQVSGAYVRRTVLLATTVRTAPGKADSWEPDR